MLSQISGLKSDQMGNPAETITEADIKGAGGTAYVAALDTVRVSLL
jgi:hypothetical protein